MPTLLDVPGEPAGFADDPIASHSARFGLARPMGTPVGHDVPSPVGVRPWNLRGAQIMGRCGARPGAWCYDHDRQLALTLDGHLMTEIIAADPSADSVSDLDGDEGKSEDWTYDFCPDNPGGSA
ncbi:MAG: hypothetical protein ACRDRS_03760 [Pseudonocardiaceae bacterium]